MRNWKQRLWSLLLCGALVASLCPTALAEGVSISYLDKDGEVQSCETYTTVTPKLIGWNTTNSPSGWYVAENSVKIEYSVTVRGTVHLILANGCDLKVIGGIEVSEGSSLTINGGTVTASGYQAAGIGGGYMDSGGNITINGGTVTATGVDGAGIGGGSDGGGGTIAINGGEVTATSKDGAGIGGGIGSAGGTITINDGTVKATSEDYGAGIGGGKGGDGGQITISGGEVTATGKSGAGIGGGGGSGDNSGDPVGGAGGNITISGGTVTATSNTGAGIGGGGGDRTASPGGAGGKIIISGGTVTATSESTGAGIGGGQRGNGGEIAINGGTVTVQSSKGADIGGGESRNGVIAPSEKIEIGEGANVKGSGGGKPNLGPPHGAKTDGWASDSTGHWHPCEVESCAEQFDKAAHSFGEWVTDQAATSTTAGSRHRVCGDCQYQETQAIPATGGGSSGGSSGGGGYVPPTYRPDVTQPSQGGSVSVSPSSPQRGDTVTVKPKPDAGYELDSITVTDRDGESVEVTAKPNGTYTFKQPAGKVKIEVTYKPMETPWSNPFADVSEDDWHYEAVRFVQEQGLMSGYSDGRFAPEDTLSRSQLAQILFNKEGRPVVNYLLQYGDVSTDTWYTEAVRWAASQGIVSGYGDGTFGPNDPITREQLAVMLWRYSGSPVATNEELHFNDESQINGYALEALRWAVENGILNGDGAGRLGPQDQATRAQAAQMLKNFIENQEDDEIQ